MLQGSQPSALLPIPWHWGSTTTSLAHVCLGDSFSQTPPNVTCSQLAIDVECLPLKPQEVYGGICHGCRGLPLPYCSPTSTLATERGVSCNSDPHATLPLLKTPNTAQHPTALASHPESSQFSPSCPSWRGQSPQEKPAPSPLPILQHFRLGVLPLPTRIPPPLLSWELHPVFKARRLSSPQEALPGSGEQEDLWGQRLQGKAISGASLQPRREAAPSQLLQR